MIFRDFQEFLEIHLGVLTISRDSLGFLRDFEGFLRDS